MKNGGNREKIKKIAGSAAAVLMCAATAVMAVFYLKGEEGGFFYVYGTALSVAAAALLAVLAVLTVVFASIGKDLLYRIFLTIIIFVFLMAALFYTLYETGFLDKIDSVEDLRNFIKPYGALSVVIFLIMQILQVIALPIPGFVSVGAGVLLYGAFWGAVLSFIGIMMGSVIAFAVGRCLGFRAACWLVGKENLEKGMALVKGKDKIILTFMFLFPFFPDDVLCFVSGLSSMSWKFFLIMITITRLISVFTTAYSVNGSLIPYDTWWGILIWAVLIVGCLFLVKVVYKHSDKIENFFKSRKK